jgi:hypothetical protein
MADAAASKAAEATHVGSTPTFPTKNMAARDRLLSALSIAQCCVLVDGLIKPIPLARGGPDRGTLDEKRAHWFGPNRFNPANR